ncbi:hypothetical protein SELMODRAFT_423500 [Selaginella moellendorffii]|uniref:Uncharacterized protein n=1 Tax=Selaginella moellendorffii TaxID=88036 RepID=D8SLX1_SELML|nr:hypothetical protein SELMODRAFT_423500 [Selaginella moellendorffii]
MAKNHRSSASLVLFFACMALGFSVEAARESFTYYWTVEESVLCGNEASNTEIKECNDAHLKIDLLQGLALPNGRQHNGCVRVDDACTKDNECNMDFYVGSESNYHNIEHELQDAESWDANIDPNCQIQDYGS